MLIRFTKGERSVSVSKHECRIMREAAALLMELDRMEPDGDETLAKSAAILMLKAKEYEVDKK